MTPRKLIRAMHARTSSRLSCGHYVKVGALIVKAGGRWICTPCRLAQPGQTTGPDQAAGQ